MRRHVDDGEVLVVRRLILHHPRATAALAGGAMDGRELPPSLAGSLQTFRDELKGFGGIVIFEYIKKTGENALRFSCVYFQPVGVSTSCDFVVETAKGYRCGFLLCHQYDSTILD
jgi:hypothetical protein